MYQQLKLKLKKIVKSLHILFV